MRNFSPADERQPQGLPTCIRTLTMRACSGTSAKKLAQHGASSGSPAKKLARHGTSSGTSAKKLAQHARKQHFSAILGSQGELFRARSHSRPSRANYFAFRRHVRDAGRRISRTGLDPGRRNMATLKPTTPLLTPNTGPLKPTTPLRPKNAPKNAHFPPAKAMAVSKPHRHKRAKAIAVSNHRATSPATPRRSARGRLLAATPMGGDDTAATQTQTSTTAPP